mgnify:CR=1 FL=1
MKIKTKAGELPEAAQEAAEAVPPLPVIPEQKAAGQDPLLLLRLPAGRAAMRALAP